MRSAVFVLLACCAHGTQTPWAYRDGAPAIEGTAHVSTKEVAEAASAGLPKLSTVRLQPGEVEVRFWIVPAFGPARGVVIRKSGSDFRALVIDRSGSRSATPSRSWDSTWNAITADGVLTLPDDASLPRDGKYILDGVAYAAEVQHDGVYRAYWYGNPAEHDWPEATSVLRIAHVLARAFRIRIDDRSAKVRARIPDDDVDATSRAIGAPCDPLDMSQSRCGANGRVSIATLHGVRSACALAPLAPPNPYGFSACVDRDRVYLASSPEYDTIQIAVVAEMTDDQRLYLQRQMRISADEPLRTIDAWRAALMR